jgi:hypothetical protein
VQLQLITVLITVTPTVAELVQPLSGSVTRTANDPESQTCGFCSLELKPFGPVQKYAAPGVDELALICVQGSRQVNAPPLAEDIFGGVVF